MEYDIVQMTTAEALARANTLDPIYHNSSAQIGRNTINFAFDVGLQLF